MFVNNPFFEQCETFYSLFKLTLVLPNLPPWFKHSHHLCRILICGKEIWILNPTERPAASSFRDKFFSRHVSANFWLMNAWSAPFTALERRGGRRAEAHSYTHGFLITAICLSSRPLPRLRPGLCVKPLSALQWVSENRLLKIRTWVQRKQCDSMNVLNSHSLSLFSPFYLWSAYFLFHFFSCIFLCMSLPLCVCACICLYVKGDEWEPGPREITSPQR